MRRRRTKFIVFEGMPGAGKTQTIRSLSKMFGKRSVVVDELILPDFLGDAVETSKIYLHAEIERTKAIKKLIGKFEYVFIDRTFLTTLAYAYARSRKKHELTSYRELVNYFRNLSKGRPFLKPTRLIIFLVDVEVSLKRRSRHSGIKSVKQWFDPGFLKDMRIFYGRSHAWFSIPRAFIKIDTTHLKPKEVSMVVKNYLA